MATNRSRDGHDLPPECTELLQAPRGAGIEEESEREEGWSLKV